jgi:hypothetical protein
MTDAERDDAKKWLRDTELKLVLANKDFLRDFETKLIERWIRLTFSATGANGAGLVATILAIKDFKDVIGLPHLVLVASIFSFGLMAGAASYVTASLNYSPSDFAQAVPHLSPEMRAELTDPSWLRKVTFNFLHLTFWASGASFMFAISAIMRFLAKAAV